MTTATELWEQLRASRDIRRLLIFADSFPGTIEGYQARELAAALEEYQSLAKTMRTVSLPNLRQSVLNAENAVRAAQLTPLDPSSAHESIAAQYRELTDTGKALVSLMRNDPRERYRDYLEEFLSSLRSFLDRWPNHPDALSFSEEVREVAELRPRVQQQLVQLEAALERVPLPQGALPEMVTIPPGRFLMGTSSASDHDWAKAFPRHEVRIDYSFEIGKFPVTFAQWDAASAVSSLGYADDCDWGRDQRPVIFVSRDDAYGFCEVLNKELKLTLRPDQYRLPSEAEWEYACRAGTTTRYFFGDDERLLDQFAWWSGNANRQTHPVGLKRPNPFGLYDMHGLVFEWCTDAAHRSYDGAPADGSAWMERDYDSPNSSIVRGGAWDDFRAPYGAADRSVALSDKGESDIGFRVARTCIG